MRRGLVGVAHLAEDLRLTRHERVEAGRDAEEVRDRLAVVPAGEHALELEPGALLQLHARAIGVAAEQVDLRAVAGREHDRLAERLGQLGRVPVLEVEALPHLERRVVMRHTEREQARGFFVGWAGTTGDDATEEPTMTDPGLDLHEWESQWAQLQEDAADSPEEALPEIVRLVEAMLTDRGFDLENPVVVEDESRDIVADFFAARDIARAAETTKIDQEDIQTALEDLAEIHDFLVDERGAP